MPPNYNYELLKNFLENKKIALIGNSKKIYKQKNNIDSFDVVIRINITPKKKYYSKVGKRCDIIMLSNGPARLLMKDTIKVWTVPFNTNFINYIPLHKKLYKNYQLYHFRNDWWQELYNQIGARPSAGASSLHFLVKLLKRPDITLFGFEHKKGNAWYAELPKQQDSHDYNAEKKYFRSLVGNNIRYADEF